MKLMLGRMSENAAIPRAMVEEGHSAAVQEAHERMLAGRYDSRFVDLRSGRRVHVVEAGEGEPLILLHGSTTSSLSHLPFVSRLSGLRAINLDRPGLGLSHPAPPAPFRQAAVAFVDEAADALGLDTFALAGASMGGTWALWYAMARPMRVRRLALLGAAPLLPGTSPPAPIRAMVTPLVGHFLRWAMPPNERMVVRLMGAMGEGETIVRHPELLASLVAAARDPVAASVDLHELRAIATTFGFRREMLLRPEELRRLDIPTLVIWGDRDPVGSVEVAESISNLLPDARLELLPAGHVPWLGHPDRVAALLSGFFEASVRGS